VLNSADMSKREGYKVFIEPDEKAQLDKYLVEVQLQHKEALTQIVRHFLRSDPVLRAAILGIMPKEYDKELASLMILRLAGETVSVRDQLLDAAATSMLSFGAGEVAEQIAAARKRRAEKPQQSHRQR